MKTRPMLSTFLTLVFAGLVANQMACNNASFEAADETMGQRAPRPDNPNSTDYPGDNGDVVRCTVLDGGVCNPGDDGLNERVPFLPDVKRPDSTRNLGNQCYENNYSSVTKSDIDEVIVWLIVDSSESFDEERVAAAGAVADGLSAKLEVDVTVSIVAGHAPTGYFEDSDGDKFYSAAPSVNVNTFYPYSDGQTQVTFTKGGDNSAARTQLTTALNRFMQESPISMAKRNRSLPQGSFYRSSPWPLGGPHSGSDELLLRNFKDALKAKRGSLASNQAFLALLMSDENDVCTPELRGGSFYYSHPDEIEMKDNYCNGIDPSSVYEELVQFAGSSPYVVGAFVYATDNIPAGSHPQASQGKGYTELIAKAGYQHGTLKDPAEASGTALTDASIAMVEGLASSTKRILGVHTDYGIFKTVNGERLSLNEVRLRGVSLDLQVQVNGQPSNYDIDSANHLIRPHDIDENTSNVQINFCLK